MKFFLLFTVLLFITCSHKKKIPDGVLSQEKMENILWDMIRADEFVLNYLSRDTTRNRQQESIKLYEQIFAIHDINQEKFEKSFSFYGKHPELLRPLMDSLEKRKKLEGEKSRNNPYMDSIQKSRMERIKKQ